MGELSEEQLIEAKLVEIRSKPYEFICDYAESVYPHAGREVFQVASLMMPSLTAPDLPFMGKRIRSNINTLFLATSGAGKTSLAKLFSKFTIEPLEVESITVAKLEDEISKRQKFSLIVGDFARMAREPILIKVLEGIIGEEKKIHRQTMRKNINMDVDGICLLCGTPQDLSHYLSGGLLFRLVPKIIIHDERKHAEIGEHIKNQIGEDGNQNITEQAIKIFYEELEMIQEGEHEKIKKINGYVIEQKFKDDAYKEWEKMTSPIVKETNFNFIRGLQEFFRFLVAHAFLNIHNRKVENGKLYPNGEDFSVALDLMVKTIQVQYDILKTERFAQSLKNLAELQVVLSSSKLDPKFKNYLKFLAKVNKGRVSVNPKK